MFYSYAAINLIMGILTTAIIILGIFEVAIVHFLTAYIIYTHTYMQELPWMLANVFFFWFIVAIELKRNKRRLKRDFKLLMKRLNFPKLAISG